MSEDNLMDRLEARENAAWQEVFPVLRKEAMSVLQHHYQLRLEESEAEDICQEVLVEVVGKFPYSSNKTMDDLRFFSRRVTLRRGIDHVRAKFAQKRGSGEVTSLDAELNEDGLTRLDLTASGLNALGHLRLREIMQALSDCVQSSIKSKERNLFQEFFMMGLTQSEINQKTGTPMGTIGVTLGRARKKVLGCITGKGFSDPY